VSPVDIFLSSFQASLANESFRKLTLGKFRSHLAGVEHVYVRSVTLKEGIRLSFVSRYPDHDLTQNHLIPDGVAMVRDWLGKASLAATLFTADQRHQLQFNRHGEPSITSGPAEPVDVQERHDREKSRLIRDETFLKYMGVLDPAGKPRTQMGDKYRQIHHFVELLAPPLRALPNCQELRVVDMGSGKGYLTFAIYAFLKQEGFKVEVAGIERRRPLVDLCNSVAGQCEFGDLRFEVGEISTARLDGVMYLDASGYVTRITEFIALEHTAKNLLIIAAKNPKPVDHDLLFRKAAAFQEQFGVTRQRLGDLLRPK